MEEDEEDGDGEDGDGDGDGDKFVEDGEKSFTRISVKRVLKSSADDAESA